MRTYRSTKTGVVITVHSEVRGDWEEITPPSSEAKKEETKAETPKRTRTKRK